MVTHIGEVIAEFRENKEAEGGYTDQPREFFLIKGRIPADGDWQAVVLTELGYEKRIPEASLDDGSGKYVVGGYEIIMRTAGLRTETNETNDMVFDLRKIRTQAEDIKRFFSTEDSTKDSTKETEGGEVHVEG